MIRAYLDESGTDDRDFVVIAGHAGPPQNWFRFMHEWKAALGPQRSRLHMRKLKWNSRSTERALARLGPCARKAELAPIVGGARVSDYADLVKGNSLTQLVPGYTAALITALTALLRECPADQDVEVVIEANDIYDHLAAMVFAACREMDGPIYRQANGEPKLSKGSILSKKSATSWLLDQADFMAFAHLQEARDPKSKKALWTAPIRGPHFGAIMSRDQARSFVSSLPRSPFTEQEMKWYISTVREFIRRGAV
jgi:Protein of unknown function (DUF3800)